MTRSSRGRVRRSHLSLLFVVLVGLMAALVSALLAGGARSASQEQGLIAFTRADGIYVMRSDGSGIRALQRSGVAAEARGLAWSPNGRKLAFATDDAIWLMNADGTRLVRVVDASLTNSPTWTPDGRRIAFSQHNGLSDENSDRDIWIVNPDGSGLSQLTELPDHFEFDVDWSPSENRIALATGGWVGAIYVLALDGSLPRRLTQPKNYSYQPDWSPDGRRIVFTRHQWDTSQLFVIDANGGRVKKLTNDSAPSDLDPAWSTDGRKIAFVRGDDWLAKCTVCPVRKRSQGEIYVMNADGTGLTRLTRNALGEASPAWQPVAAR